jgi:hypothetical protein
MLVVMQDTSRIVFGSNVPSIDLGKIVDSVAWSHPSPLYNIPSAPITTLTELMSAKLEA